MIIQRPHYLQSLIDRREDGSIKIITGIRRCGKSFLLSKLYRQYLLDDGVPEDNIIFINLDMRSQKEYRDPDAMLRYVIGRIGEGMLYVMIDEVQLMDDFESVLNELNSYDNTDIYVTGSNSKFLSKDVITEFRGRGEEVRIRPLSFKEFFDASEMDRYDALDEYMKYGGMPEILSHKTEKAKRDYLSKLFSETYLKDVIERNRFGNEDLLSRITDSLSSSVGSLTNPLRTCKALHAAGYQSLDNETVSRYIKALEDAYIFEKVDRFDVRGKEYYSTPSKYYAADVGIRNARLNFRQLEYTHLMENIVYNELRSRGFDVDVGVVGVREMVDGHFLNKKLEIDFVVNDSDRRYYVQSAYSMPDEEKRSQEIRPFLKLNDGFGRVIVTSDRTLPWIDDNGVLTVNILDFLLDDRMISYVHI